MDIKKIVVGPLETNCYIVTIDNESIIIDPGDDFLKIKKELDIPLISKMTKNKDSMLTLELETTKIYALSLPNVYWKDLVEKEYKNNINKGEIQND